MKTVMKRASALSLVALLSLSASALADGPTYDQTTRYITDRCVGAEGGDSLSLHKMETVEFDRARVTVGKRTIGSSTEFFFLTGFDIRDVTISRYEIDRGQDRGLALVGVAFRCGDNCISATMSTFTNKKPDGPPKDMRWPDDWLICREADKVVKAFTHLQTLVGGKKKDLFGD